ncbi:MAG: HlyD family type I secretion periplasmic adaptor subunit [Candidatus Latescibacterota bacterium]
MSENLNLRTGEFVFREGETANYAYVLVEGNVEIVKSTGDGYLTLTTIEKGAIFGEMALIDGQPRSAGARVSKDAVITEVNAQTFIQYIQGNPTAALNIMKRLSVQLRDANKQVSTLGDLAKDDNLDEEFDHYLDENESSLEESVLDTDHIYNAGPKKSILLAGVTVSTAFILAILFLSIFSVDTTVHTSGKFLTTVPNIEVQATNNSVIKQLKVSRGSVVKRGEVIAVLDGTIARSNLKANQDKISASENKLYRIRLEQNAIKTGRVEFVNDENFDPVNRDILLKRIQQYQSKNISLDSQNSKLTREILSSENNVKLAENQLALKVKIRNVQKSLYDQKVSSYFKFLSAKDSSLVAEKAVADAKAKLDKLRSELRIAQANKKEFNSKWVSSLGENQANETEKLTQFEEDRVKLLREAYDVEVRAPADGVVLDLPKLGFGSIVKEGDKLFTLVRSNVPLALEIDVDPKDINDVRINAVASIKLDALPFQEYGDIKGTLVYVSEDTYDESLSGDKGAFYRARLKVVDSEFKKLPNDFRLTSGMTASADLLIGKRKLMTYLTRPITKGFRKAFSEPD